MMTRQKENTTPLRGVWQTIAAGFDLTSKHLWLVILPVILDCFLWLGPRLSGRLLIEQFVGMLPADPTLADLNSQLLALAPRTNLFTSLSVPLAGIPALMVGVTPEKTPLTPQVIELNSVGLWLGLFLVLTLAGVLLTAVYFVLIARAVRSSSGVAKASGSGMDLWARIGRMWLNFLALGVLLLILGFILYVPLLPIALLLGVISPVFGALVVLLGPVILLWVIIYLFFAPHGLAMYGRSLYQAVSESLLLVRTHFASTLGLLLVVFIIRNLLGMVLLIADDGSWLTLASIMGHAFVMTSLTAATFIFYRDRHPLSLLEGQRQPHSTLEQSS